MYQALIFLHSLFRWLVLASLAYSIRRGRRGEGNRLAFARTDNSVRHWTATIAQVQLLIGLTLYGHSPLVRYFWKSLPGSAENLDALFFSAVHIAMMVAAITIITIASAKAKRAATDALRFRTMWRGYLLALGLILLAVPWPFSPLVSRPFFR